MEPTPTNESEYTRLMRETLKDLEIELLKTKAEISASSNEDQLRKLLRRKVAELLEGSYNDLKAADKPETVFIKAFQQLEKAKQMQFLLDNMLEGLKRNEEPKVLLKRYVNLDLIELNEIDKDALNQEDKKSESEKTNLTSILEGFGGFLKGLLRGVGKFGNILANFACLAIKSIPKYIKVKPTLSFPLGVPTIGFLLDIEGIPLQDFFDLLKQAIA